MRWARIAGAGMAAVLAWGLGQVAVAPRADAGVVVTWEFGARSAGMPSTSEPSRTVAHARAEFRDLGYPEQPSVEVSVALAAVPEADTDAALVVSFGTATESGCGIAWQRTVSTTTPGPTAQRDGAVVVLRSELVEEDRSHLWDCALVTVAAPEGGTVHDEVTGEPGDMVIIDAAGRVAVEDVSRTRVEPRRWTSIRVVLANRLAAVPEVLLTGRGKGARVRPLVVEGMLHDERRAVRLEVKLLRDRARRVVLTTRPGGVAFARTDTRTVVLRPRR